MTSPREALKLETITKEEKLQINNDIEKRFTFFDLPPEIRLMIYRLLLRQSKPIKSPKSVRLSPSILRTCRRILNEARPVLLRENIWEFMIWEKSGQIRSSFMGTTCIQHDDRPCYEIHIHGPPGFKLRTLKRFHILVITRNDDTVSKIRRALTRLCGMLSGLRNLHYVSVSLRNHHTYDDVVTREYYTVLENFTLLRRVRRVEFNGVPPAYAKYLTDKMTGSEPLDSLTNMYGILHSYAGHIKNCDHLFQKANRAVEETNVDMFKDARKEILERATRHIDNLFDHLFDYDARQKHDSK
ncbi:hypothetical protein K449DRAFT_470420 [Hypoxylon sp. EC38]|nr:hypothetical protein K449DRAFT_470420 [Hypoxylon sp. EC38]